MTYLERQGDEALRLRFRMQKKEPLKYDRSAAAVCCTKNIVLASKAGTPTTGGTTAPVEEAIPDDNNRNLQETGGETGGETAEVTSEETPVTTTEATTDGNTDSTTENPTTEEETKVTGFDPKSNIGKCFGMAFTCGIPGGCKGSTELGLVLYQSTVEGKTWKAATNDYSAQNVGSVGVGKGTDFSTRYGMNLKQAQDSSVPLIGVDYTTDLSCYVAYDVARADAQFSLDIDLSDTSKWNYNDKVEVKISEDELSEENEVSGAIQQIVPLGLLVTLSLVNLI